MGLLDNYHLLHDLRDPRVDGYPLMSSPFIPIFIVAFYLHLVFNALPVFMKGRKPYQLTKILMIFNILQVVCNAQVSYFATKVVLKYNWFCQPVDYTDNEDGRLIIKYGYCFFLLKVIDLLDTIFFVLRGKQSQVTFLHVYHHFGMIFVIWAGVKYFCGGHSAYIPAVNSFVHTVMYFYYFLTSWDSKYKKSIWWKKHITQLQLAQFVFIFFTFGQLYFQKNCDYSKLGVFFMTTQSIVMIILFGNFYRKAYLTKPHVS